MSKYRLRQAHVWQNVFYPYKSIQKENLLQKSLLKEAPMSQIICTVLLFASIFIFLREGKRLCVDAVNKGSSDKMDDTLLSLSTLPIFMALFLVLEEKMEGWISSFICFLASAPSCRPNGTCELLAGIAILAMVYVFVNISTSRIIPYLVRRDLSRAR